MKWVAGILPFSFLLSLLMHLSIGGVLHLAIPRKAPETEKTSIEVEYLSASMLESKRAQIVEQDKRLNDEIDPNSRLLGKFNQKIEQQMRASESGKTKDNNGGGGVLSQNQVLPQIAKPQKIKPGVGKKRRQKLELADLQPQFDFSPHKNNVHNPQAYQGESSQSSDYIQDIKRGNQNLLSTREFRYYSYFTRIRNQLQQYWEPSVRHRLHKLVRSGRSIASQNPRTTKVLITLNRQGNLVRVQVLEDSGLRDLDEAAIDAFREAAPFPNPPVGIVDPDGTVKIRWDFVLEA